MYLKKISILVLFFIFIQSSLISFADDFDDYYEETFSPLNSNLTTSHDIPDINARHAVVLDRASKTVLFGKNENETCKMASTTKIITALIVIENTPDLNSITSISKKASRNRWFEAWAFF